VNLENPSFAEIARAMGAEGVRVERLDDVASSLSKACEAQKAGKTTVLEVMCTMELGDPFRRDALKYPERLLEKYRHTNVNAPG
jgi:sulfoacetaldehyde acetyltransferase